MSEQDDPARPVPLAPGPRGSGRDARDGWRIGLVLGLAWLAAVNCRVPLLSIGPLLPLIIADLHLSSTVAGALTGLPLLLMGIGALPGGLLVDRVGARLLLAASMLTIALAGGLRGLVQSDLVLLAASVALGVGIGVTQPALPQVARAVSQRRAGLATAVYANGLMLGAFAAVALTVPVLLPLAGSASWRGVLLLWALPALLAALGWALLDAPELGPSGADGRGIGFRQVLALPGLHPLALVFATQGAIFYASTTWLPEYYVAQGWSLDATAGLLVLLSVTSTLGSLVAPVMVLWWGGLRPPLLVAGVVTLAGTLGLAVAPDLAVAWVSAIGFGVTVAFVLGMAAPAELAPRDKVGAAAGVLLALGYLGSVLGPLGFGALRDLSGGFGLSLGFLIAAGVAQTLASAAVPAEKQGDN